MDDREKEIKKYIDVYSKHSVYRMSNGRRDAIAKVLYELSGSLLDVSCGRGELIAEARKLGFAPVYGTEAVPELCNDSVKHAEITALPFADKEFDVVICVDVIEHILEPDIVPGLKELERVCRGTVIIAAADYPDIWDGENLHPSARPYPEWDRLFRQTFSGTVTRIGPTSTSEMWAVHYGRV